MPEDRTENVLHVLRQVIAQNVPSRFSSVRLKNLEPSQRSKLPLARQEQVLAVLRDNPTGSYAFFGPAGTGKTTFSVALYTYAVSLFGRFLGSRPDIQPSLIPPVWRLSAKLLLEDFVAESLRETVDGKPGGTRIHPKVNRAKIKDAVKCGHRPCLFLEEIDKLKYTEFKVNALFEVIDAIYEAEGQLVFDTNLTIKGLAEKIGAEVDPEVAGAIFRRIADGTFFDFFDQK